MPATTTSHASAGLCARSRSGRIAAVLAALVAAILALGLQPAAAQDGRDPAYAEFYEALDPHGEWVVHPRYGGSWVPYANQDRDWRPYSRGQWVFTVEHGWYWESEEEFGWVVYHYGRWLTDQHYGWMWVPGREWGPAWVAWREGEEEIGWAPLPPEAELDAGADGAVTFEAYASPRYAPMWMFVPVAMMTAPAIYRHFHPSARNTNYFGRTRFVTHYSWRDRRIYNRGISPRLIERHSRRPVPIVQVRPQQTPQGLGRRPGAGEPRQVGIYRPQLPQGPGPGRPGGWQGQPVQPGIGRPQRGAVAAPPGPDGFDLRPHGRQRPPFGGEQQRAPVSATPPYQQPRTMPPAFPPQQPAAPIQRQPFGERGPVQQQPPRPPGFGGAGIGQPPMGQPVPPRPPVQQMPQPMPPRPQVQQPPPQRPLVQQAPPPMPQRPQAQPPQPPPQQRPRPPQAAPQPIPQGGAGGFQR